MTNWVSVHLPSHRPNPPIFSSFPGKKKKTIFPKKITSQPLCWPSSPPHKQGKKSRNLGKICTNKDVYRAEKQHTNFENCSICTASSSRSVLHFLLPCFPLFPHRSRTLHLQPNWWNTGFLWAVRLNCWGLKPRLRFRWPVSANSGSRSLSFSRTVRAPLFCSWLWKSLRLSVSVSTLLLLRISSGVTRFAVFSALAKPISISHSVTKIIEPLIRNLSKLALESRNNKPKSHFFKLFSTPSQFSLPFRNFSYFELLIYILVYK